MARWARILDDMSNAATQSAALPALIQQAIGRIFALGSRPAQPGDVAEYERCKAIIEGYAAAQVAK